jgi:predicted anti-sigma-YlaC factor YlaD
MNEHPRDTTLEYFVLGSKTLTDADRDAIGRHLERCPGCRALADTMAEFYCDLRNELGNFNQSTQPRRTS